MKFVLNCIPIFDNKIGFMKKNVDGTLLSQKWHYSTCVPFKTLISDHQDQFQLRHIAKKDMESSQKRKMLQFHVGYMT